MSQSVSILLARDVLKVHKMAGDVEDEKKDDFSCPGRRGDRRGHHRELERKDH